MLNTKILEGAEAIALRRFELVTDVKNTVDQLGSLSAALACVAHKTQSQPLGPVAVRTLEDWFYAHQKGGFPALKPKPRADRGATRTLSPGQQRQVLDAVRAQPGIPIKVHYRRWKEQEPLFPSLSSVHRLLWHHELHGKARRHLLRQALGGPTKAFECAGVNELWMVDFSPGPYLTIPGEPKALATQLCVFLDDHSRLIPCARYDRAADTRTLHAVFKEALRRRGVPRALYADNGGPFVNDHTRLVCAQLDVRLLHTRPYHAWSKGKVERFFFTLQQDFEAGLKLPGAAPTSLAELNQRLAHWLGEYHARRHSTTGETPEARFARQVSAVRSLDPTRDLDRLFYAEVTRRVRKDGTVRLENDWFEVDLCLCGLEARLRFDPWTHARVEVDYRGQSFGLARKLDRHLNSQISPSAYDGQR